MEFHNINSDICSKLYSFNEQLIRNVCKDLEREDMADEMVGKYLSDKFKQVKPMKDPTKPKKSLTAFMLFCNANRERVSSTVKGLGDIAKTLGKEWGALSPADRKPFILKSEELREQYEEELSLWKAQK